MSATKKMAIHHVSENGWVHTHGLDQFGLPELEIRNVPPMFAEAAAQILQEVGEYLREPGVVVKSGETMAVSPHTAFRLVAAEPISGNEDHYEVERWELVPFEQVCECCGCSN